MCLTIERNSPQRGSVRNAWQQATPENDPGRAMFRNLGASYPAYISPQNPIRRRSFWCDRFYVILPRRLSGLCNLRILKGF